jgi:hypothetical protein
VVFTTRGCPLTIHSSRSRFAARLNSGVRSRTTGSRLLNGCEAASAARYALGSARNPLLCPGPTARTSPLHALRAACSPAGVVRASCRSARVTRSPHISRLGLVAPCGSDPASCGLTNPRACSCASRAFIARIRTQGGSSIVIERHLTIHSSRTQIATRFESA